MPQKTKRKTTSTTSEATAPLVMETARKQYEKAVRTGQQLQEEAGQWWSRMWTQAMPSLDWQKQMTRYAAMTGNVLPLAQRGFEDLMNFMNASTRANAELVRSAVEAAQAPPGFDDQGKWLNCWTTSLKAIQSSVEAAGELSTRTIDSWISFARKNTQITEIRVPKTA